MSSPFSEWGNTPSPFPGTPASPHCLMWVFFGMLFNTYGAEWPKILNKYLMYENCSDICVCCLTTCACFAIFSLLFTLGLCLASCVKFRCNIFRTEFAGLLSTVSSAANWATWLEWVSKSHGQLRAGLLSLCTLQGTCWKSKVDMEAWDFLPVMVI